MATLIITDEDNGIINNEFQYLLKFQPSLGGIVLRKNTIYVFLDARYFDKTHEFSKEKILKKLGKEEIVFIKTQGDMIEEMLTACKDSKTLKVEDNLTLKYYNRIKFLNAQNIEIIPPYFKEKRVKKFPSEFRKIKEAISIIDSVYFEIEKLVTSTDIIGKTERDIRNFIVQKVLEFGGEKESFDAIVAYGKNSSIPHHNTGDTIISTGPLLIDMGAVYKGYCSDFTRTFWIGDSSGGDYHEFQEVYNTVAQAHKNALAFAKPGVKCADIDSVAREYISKHGYGEYFSHSTGHGVGLNIHEKPSISSKSEDILESGMVFTIEPGIYIPGKFGVRLENIVFATDTDVESVSKAPF